MLNLGNENCAESIAEEGSACDEEKDVPEEEDQKDLFVDDVLGQDAEAIFLVDSSAFGDNFKAAADLCRKGFTHGIVNPKI